MSVDLSVPVWVEDYVKAWADRLMITHWRIRIELAMVVNGDEDNRASCFAQSNINTASLMFRADIEDTESWRKTVIHEMLHIRHARIDAYVRDALVPQIAEAAQPLGAQAYVQHMESYINGMTDTLYWCTRWRDYPEEYTRDTPPQESL